jgi:hypothetical protein
MVRIMVVISMVMLSIKTLHAEILISKDQYLYVPQSDNRRLLLEPGSILLRKPVTKEETYKKRVRVISSGGVEGEVKSRGVDSVNDMSGKLAYVKDNIEIKGNTFPIGTVFPVKIIDDEDDYIIYEVTYVKSIYSVKQSGFVMREKHSQYTENEFMHSFNLIDPVDVSHYKFPFWKENKRHKPTEWGCGESKAMTTMLDASTSAGIEASGGFFGFFQAKVEASAGAKTSSTFTKTLEDNTNKHRITYWSLVSSTDNSKIIMNIAFEKISLCDKSKGVNNSYIIRFEKQLGIDEITINSAWVGGNKFKKGGGSPLRIDNQSDLLKFENALKDFKFMHSIDGYNIKRAIIDFSIRLTVNLNYAAKS